MLSAAAKAERKALKRKAREQAAATEVAREEPPKKKKKRSKVRIMLAACGGRLGQFANAIAPAPAADHIEAEIVKSG